MKVNTSNILEVTGVDNAFLDNLPCDSSVVATDGQAYIDLDTADDFDNGIRAEFHKIGVLIPVNISTICVSS